MRKRCPGLYSKMPFPFLWAVFCENLIVGRKTEEILSWKVIFSSLKRRLKRKLAGFTLAQEASKEEWGGGCEKGEGTLLHVGYLYFIFDQK
jgi:hypothetical protein